LFHIIVICIVSHIVSVSVILNVITLIHILIVHVVFYWHLSIFIIRVGIDHLNMILILILMCIVVIVILKFNWIITQFYF